MLYEASLYSIKNKIESLEFDAITKNIENKNLNKRITELEKLNEDLTEKNSWLEDDAKRFKFIQKVERVKSKLSAKCNIKNIDLIYYFTIQRKNHEFLSNLLGCDSDFFEKYLEMIRQRNHYCHRPYI